MPYQWNPQRGTQSQALRKIGRTADACKAAGWKWLYGAWIIPDSDREAAQALGARAFQWRKPSLGEPNGYDLLNWIAEKGGIRPAGPKSGGEWDDAPAFRGVHARLVRDTGVPVDVLADMAEREGWLDEGLPAVLWARVRDAMDARSRSRRMGPVDIDHPCMLGADGSVHYADGMIEHAAR